MIKLILFALLAFFAIGFIIMFWVPILFIGFLWLIYRAFFKTERRVT